MSDLLWKGLALYVMHLNESQEACIGICKKTWSKTKTRENVAANFLIVAFGISFCLFEVGLTSH